MLLTEMATVSALHVAAGCDHDRRMKNVTEWRM